MSYVKKPDFINPFRDIDGALQNKYLQSTTQDHTDQYISEECSTSVDCLQNKNSKEAKGT